MHTLAFVDDRPCSARRPCSLNYALLNRSDVSVVLLRALGERHDAEYERATDRVRHFYVDTAKEAASEARRFRRWSKRENCMPTRFCCMSEPRQEYWQEFARELNLPALPAEVSHALRHKPTMKAWVRAAGLDTTPYGVARDIDDLFRFAGVYGYPLILKPTSGWGSMYTFVLRDGEDIPPYEQHLYQREMMIEKFISAREYECCALIAAGRVLDVFPSIMPASPLGATRGAINANISVGNKVRLVPAINLMQVVQRLVDGFRLEWGYLHFEFFVAPDGSDLLISELALRYPGCEIAKNHGLALGFDIAHQTINVYLHEIPELRYKQDRCVGDLLLPYRQGLVTYVTSEFELQRQEGVLEVNLGTSVGEVLPPQVDSSFNCSGWVIVEGQTPEEVESRMKRILSLYRIETDAVQEAHVEWNPE